MNNELVLSAIFFVIGASFVLFPKKMARRNGYMHGIKSLKPGKKEIIFLRIVGTINILIALLLIFQY